MATAKANHLPDLAHYVIRSALVEAKLMTESLARDAVYAATLTEELRNIEVKIAATEKALQLGSFATSIQQRPCCAPKDRPDAKWIREKSSGISRSGNPALSREPRKDARGQAAAQHLAGPPRPTDNRPRHGRSQTGRLRAGQAHRSLGNESHRLEEPGCGCHPHHGAGGLQQFRLITQQHQVVIGGGHWQAARHR